MREKRTATEAELRRASARLQKIFQSLPMDAAYSIVSAHLHAVLDQLPVRTADTLLMLFVTEAMESRHAGA
jgi:hypothetical protein